MMRTEHPIFNALRSLLDAGNFHYESLEDASGEFIARLNVVAANGHWSGTVKCRSESHTLRLMGLFPAKIQATRAPEIGRLVEQMNRRVDFGHFHLVDDASSLIFRLSAIVPEEVDTAELVRAHLQILEQTMDDAFPLVMSVAYGDWTAQVAFEKAPKKERLSSNPSKVHLWN